MNLLWPMNPTLDPGGVARLGRVLHWAITAGAVACFASGANIINEEAYSGAAAMMYGGGLFLFGRAMRYILSGE